jgi:eukaryotic-like serine/threonine-protein kinase
MEEILGKKISHYKILEKLGQGGMGMVYKAEDTKLQRTVALKFISTEKMGKEESRKRFLREAQAAAALDHPNIGTIYEIDEAQGQIFLAMSYIKGFSLGEKIKLSPLSVEEALDISMQVTEGLQEAHEKGIIHRDIKSSNIMITKKRQAVIMDFGLAKLKERSKITQTATIMGTVAYMSPEQALGEEVDLRTDIWSLGVMMYEMLTGKLPFEAHSDQLVLHSILQMNPPPVTSKRSGIPLEFEAVINKCLEKDPDDRYQTAADLKADLRRLKRDEASGQTRFPIRSVKKAPFPHSMKKALIPAALMILLLFLLLLIPSTRQSIEKWFGFEIVKSEKRLAVLPFTVVGGDESDHALIIGLTDTLTRKLIRLESFQESLWVLPLENVIRYNITNPSRAYRVFGVPFSVTGSFKRMGNIFSLTLNLIDAKTMTQLKSRTITDQMANISTLQEGVATHILEMLSLELSPQAGPVLRAGETTDLDAFQSFLKGIGHTPRRERQGDLDKAIRFFEQAVEEDPHYVLAFIELSRAYLKKFDQTKNPIWVKKAQLSCQHAVEMSESFSSSHVMLGAIYRKMGRDEEAIKNFQRALELDPLDYEAAQELARMYENKGRLDEAIKLLKKFIDIKPGYWAVYSNLGYFYYHQGNYEQAEKMYRYSTEFMTENVNDYNNLMAIYYQLGDIESAREAFEKSVAIEPDAHTYINMGTIYFYQRRYADAMAMYEEAIELGGDEYYVWSYLADSCRFAGHKEKAPDAYKHAIQLAEEELKMDPNNALLLSRMAVIYAQLKNQKKAFDHISRAEELASNDVSILLNSILVFEIIGQRDQALQAFKKYLQQGGSLEEIRGQADLSGLRTDSLYQKITGKEVIE